MEKNKCKDCKWWTPAILVCFHNANECMRVFDGDQKACDWFNKLLLYRGYEDLD